MRDEVDVVGRRSVNGLIQFMSFGQRLLLIFGPVAHRAVTAVATPVAPLTQMVVTRIVSAIAADRR
jgi:carbohydrate-binding DOMON domain-containing protein